MAGTFTEQTELATSNTFISNIRVAMVKRAVELLESDTAQDYRTLSQCKAILDNAAADAVSMAWRVACGNATIAGAAPSIPSDGDTQYAVNQFLEIIK